LIKKSKYQVIKFKNFKDVHLQEIYIYDDNFNRDTFDAGDSNNSGLAEESAGGEIGLRGTKAHRNSRISGKGRDREGGSGV